MEAALQQVLTRCCGAASLLEIGCGSSGLAERAHILGFKHILASDISKVSLPFSTMAYSCQRTCWDYSSSCQVIPCFNLVSMAGAERACPAWFQAWL